MRGLRLQAKDHNDLNWNCYICSDQAIPSGMYLCSSNCLICIAAEITEIAKYIKVWIVHNHEIRGAHVKKSLWNNDIKPAPQSTLLFHTVQYIVAVPLV